MRFHLILLNSIMSLVAILIVVMQPHNEVVGTSEEKPQVNIWQLCSTLLTEELNIEALADDDEFLRPITGYDEQLVMIGATNYDIFCANCHGEAGEGIAELGPPMVRNTFTRAMSDEALMRFIINGRAADDLFNISGVAMPPRAGFPNLTDVQIQSIVAYVRILDTK